MANFGLIDRTIAAGGAGGMGQQVDIGINRHSAGGGGTVACRIGCGDGDGGVNLATGDFACGEVRRPCAVGGRRDGVVIAIHADHDRRPGLGCAGQSDAVGAFDKVHDAVGFDARRVHGDEHFGVDMNGAAGGCSIASLIGGDGGNSGVISACRHFGGRKSDRPCAACGGDDGMADTAHRHDNRCPGLRGAGDCDASRMFGGIDCAIAANRCGGQGNVGQGIHGKAASGAGRIAVVIDRIHCDGLFIFAAHEIGGGHSDGPCGPGHNGGIGVGAHDDGDG